MSVRDWSDFSARDYLQEYYADMGGENVALVQFLVDAFRRVQPTMTVLDFGGGPTLYTLIAAANKVQSIDFCDYLQSNLDEINRWLQNDPSTFDWTHFITKTLELEHHDSSPSSVNVRAAQIRQHTTRVMLCDASLPQPLYDLPYTYDVLVSNFCVESATDDFDQWRRYFHNMVSLLKPNGQLFTSALRGATSYSVGEHIFPAVYIHERQLHDMLIETGFDPATIHISSVPADRPSRHYDGLMMARATKFAAS